MSNHLDKVISLRQEMQTWNQEFALILRLETKQNNNTTPIKNNRGKGRNDLSTREVTVDLFNNND